MPVFFLFYVVYCPVRIYGWRMFYVLTYFMCCSGSILYCCSASALVPSLLFYSTPLSVVCGLLLRMLLQQQHSQEQDGM
jgi:hypothetical protein